MQQVVKEARPKGFEVKTTVEVTNQDVSYLLCGAFEGGSNYWYMIEGYEGLKEARKEFSELGLSPDDKEFKHIWLPLTRSGSISVSNGKLEGEEPVKTWVLDRKSIQKGLEVMQKQEPRHWNNLIQDNQDAETGDVFLQCCLFGEVIYG